MSGHHELDRCVQRQLRYPHCTSRMHAAVAENGGEESGGVVKNTRLIDPARSAADVTLHTDQGYQPIETSKRRLDLCEHIERRELGGLATHRFAELGPYATWILQLAVCERKLRKR